MNMRLYSLATTLLTPVISLYLMGRKWKGKEDPVRFCERKGHAGRVRPEGALVWVHCASVGESISVLPLIDRILAVRPNVHVMVTTGTRTSAKLMAERLPGRAFHQYIPVDRISYVRRFLDHWKPDLAFWAESEFWPNMLTETASREVPLALINGRISERSFKGWERAPNLIKHILSCFNICFGQTEQDAERLRRLGARNVACAGNLKWAAPPLPYDQNEFDLLTKSISGRACWLAASTHAGEEKLIWQVQQKIITSAPDTLTVIVPRHPDRGAEITNLLRGLGAVVSQRSRTEPVTAETNVYVADTMGELGLFYRLASVAFIGKSLAPARGGQNPIEAGLLGCAIVYGPNMDNFVEICQRMEVAGAARKINSANELSETVLMLLRDEEARSKLAQTAEKFAVAEGGVLDNLMNQLEPFLSLLPSQNSKSGEAKNEDS